MLRHIRVALSIAYLSLILVQQGSCSAECRAKFLKSKAKGDDFVRLFFVAENNNYFHVPLLLQAVGDRDSRLNTAPITENGRIAFITRESMNELEQIISQVPLQWCISDKVGPLEKSVDLHSANGMALRIASSAGTLDSVIDPGHICSTLESFDSSIKTERALWEFQLYRIGYHCIVPHFKSDAYPDRIP